MLISTATAGQVDLIVSTGGFGLQFWDGAGTLGNGAIDGGTATWNNATTNWTAADGLVNAPWQGGFAVFQGTAGTVTLGEPIALEGMQFRTSGYLVEGGGFGLAAAPDTIIRVDPGVTATVNAPIADGAGGPTLLTKGDAGLLVLGGTNSYTGGTLVDGGALQVGADLNLGAASGALGLDAGTLVTTASFASGARRDAGREWRHLRDRRRHPADARRRDRRHGPAFQDRCGHARPLRHEHLFRRHVPRWRACWPSPATPISVPPADCSISPAERCASTPASTPRQAAP